jgi:hypothetical protein
MTSIAQQLPAGLVTEDEILDAGFAIMKQRYGAKTARYYFMYNEDYPADLIAEYEFLQQQKEVA